MELTGKAVSQGIVLGKVLRYTPFVPQLNTAPLSPDDVPGALSRLRNGPGPDPG